MGQGMEINNLSGAEVMGRITNYSISHSRRREGRNWEKEVNAGGGEEWEHMRVGCPV